jgi:hypothetical protein
MERTFLECARNSHTLQSDVRQRAMAGVMRSRFSLRDVARAGECQGAGTLALTKSDMRQDQFHFRMKIATQSQ